MLKVNGKNKDLSEVTGGKVNQERLSVERRTFKGVFQGLSGEQIKH
jgi:hypothetical protein